MSENHHHAALPFMVQPLHVKNEPSIDQKNDASISRASMGIHFERARCRCKIMFILSFSFCLSKAKSSKKLFEGLQSMEWQKIIIDRGNLSSEMGYFQCYSNINSNILHTRIKSLATGTEVQINANHETSPSRLWQKLTCKDNLHARIWRFKMARLVGLHTGQAAQWPFTNLEQSNNISSTTMQQFHSGGVMVRASALCLGGRWSNPDPGTPKSEKNGPCRFLADAHHLERIEHGRTTSGR